MKFFQRRAEKKACVECKERKARFRLNNKVKWDADHKLCFKCYRALVDSQREFVRAERRLGFPSFSFEQNGR